ncbi:hypothetical protein FQR65_LT17048 [Abscondita terminalis]|nr:hypothetical protein FQR65_LT17048 [Abscondita terminalis]
MATRKRSVKPTDPDFEEVVRKWAEECDDVSSTSSIASIEDAEIDVENLSDSDEKESDHSRGMSDINTNEEARVQWSIPLAFTWLRAENLESSNNSVFENSLPNEENNIVISPDDEIFTVLDKLLGKDVNHVEIETYSEFVKESKINSPNEDGQGKKLIDEGLLSLVEQMDYASLETINEGVFAENVSTDEEVTITANEDTPVVIEEIHTIDKPENNTSGIEDDWSMWNPTMLRQAVSEPLVIEVPRDSSTSFATPDVEKSIVIRRRPLLKKRCNSSPAAETNKKFSALADSKLELVQLQLQLAKKESDTRMRM